MDLVGAWLRGLLKGGAAAALVPAAMVGALAVVVAGAGGVGGLDSLGQLVSGPRIPPAEQQERRDAGETRDRELAPVAPAVASESATPAVAPAPSAPRRERRSEAPRTPPPAPPPAPPPPPAVAPAPPPAPAPAPRPPADVTAPLVDGLKSTVDEVGTAVQEIIEAVGQTLGRIVRPPPPPPAP